MSQPHNLLKYEEEAFNQGFFSIAGIDEAGRGPLAGPVVAAACILPRGLLIEGVDDSKKLSPAQRESLYERLTADPEIHFGIGVIDSLIIDQINILQATYLAMLEAVKNLSKTPDYILVDGNRMPRFPFPSKAVIKGDSLSHSIAAASIIAKVKRDRMMLESAKLFPHYFFEQHKGYGTKGHLEALRVHGPCSIHRKTFEPIKSLYTERNS